MGTLLTGAAILAAVIFIILGMLKDKKKGKSLQCGGDCKHCGGQCSH